MELVIGNKNYSSWSLRPWLLLSYFNIPFEETRIPLAQARTHELLAEYSPSFKVPVLIDNDLIVWESMAICEYINETYLNGQAYPAPIKDRALARAYCSEMHAGFSALRTELPMNIRAMRRVKISDKCEHDIHRIDGMWQDALNRHDGDFLFGNFSIVDCMFAPVATRFATYNIEVSDTSLAYMDALLSLPAMQAWSASATNEQEVIAASEVGSSRA